MVNINRLLKSEMNLLLCLHVLLEEQSVSKTANRLHLTQSAVSKQLTRLRVVFDDKLFERESKGLLPTPKALALAPKIQKILLQVEQLIIPEEFEPNQSDRVFSIDLVETAYPAIYQKFMPTALSQAPNITINSKTWNAESFTRLLKRDIDFGICIFELDERARSHIKKNIPKQLNYVELMQDHSVCLMRKDHPALEEEWNIDTFVKYRHIQVVTGGIDNWLLPELLDSKELKIDKAVNVSDLNSAIKLCEQGDFLMCYPYNSVREFIDNSNIVMKPLPLELKPGALFLLWHKHFEIEPSHKWMRELIISQSIAAK